MTSLDYAQTLVILLAAMLALTALARRLLIPYPILLVLGGLVLGFLPRMAAIELEPDLIFLVFLPPILWAAAYFTSLREFRQNIRPIGLLALGLVLVTTLAVAAVIHLLVPGLGWAPALALGAIVSPPDAVAATAIGRGLKIPRRIVSILEGESLVNDASALILYRAAVAATVTGVFVLRTALFEFLFAGAVGVLLGLAVGWLCSRVLRSLDDGFTEIAVTLLAPYIAWVAAEQVHASAVLACVAGGLYLRWQYSSITAPATRLHARAVWEQLVFLLNGFIFILIGLQLGVLRSRIPSGEVRQLILQGVAVSLTAIVVRLVWVPIATVVPRWLSPSLAARDPLPPAKALFLVGWVGMRGIVSLASALALPLALADGSPFPYRSQIILITFGVILSTLVIQGLALTPIVRWLGFAPDTELAREEAHARERASAAALERLTALADESWPVGDQLERLREFYAGRQRQYSAAAAPQLLCGPDQAEAYRRLRHEALSAERRTLVDLRNRSVISDEVLHRLEHELDVEALRVGVGELRVAGG